MIQIQISKDLSDPRFQIVEGVAVRVIFIDDETGVRKSLLGELKTRNKPKRSLLTEDMKKKVLAALRDQAWRFDVRSSNWVGACIAPACGLDAQKEEDKARLSDIIKQLVSDGTAVIFEKHDHTRTRRKYLKVASSLFD